MAVKPLDDTIARYLLWGGAALSIGSRFLDPDNSETLLLVGLFFIIVGLVTLPEHPAHYHDYSNDRREE